jgi:hypothetical protein
MTASSIYRVGCPLPTTASVDSDIYNRSDAAIQLLDVRRRRLIGLLEAVHANVASSEGEGTGGGGGGSSALLCSIAVTSIVSSFRLLSASEAAVHDIDLTTLVRRSWFGELNRDKAGAPRSATFRFPLLHAASYIGGVAELPHPTAASSSSSERQTNVSRREHGTVVCVVQRSGFVSLHTSSCVEDIGGIAQFVHGQLRPNVCAAGTGAELEHSIANILPADLRLIHFGAKITLPKVLFALMRHVNDAAQTTSRRTTTSHETKQQLPIRKLREACSEIWGRSANIDVAMDDRVHGGLTPPPAKTKKNAATIKRMRQEHDSFPAQSSSMKKNAESLERRGGGGGGGVMAQKSYLTASPSVSVFDMDPNSLSFGASVAAGAFASNNFRDLWDRPSAASAVGVKEDDAMLASLFQQQSEMLSMTDVFQFASMVPNMIPQEESPAAAAASPLQSENGRLRATDGGGVIDATSESSGGGRGVEQHQHERDVLISRRYRELCHVDVLPSREEHKELRLQFTLTEHHQKGTGGGAALHRGVASTPASQSATTSMITLSFSYTGTVRVVRADTLALVVWVVEQIVLPLLVDVLVLGISSPKL